MAGDPTSTFPYNCVVLIESPIANENGYYLQGSGVVIGPHTVLTASHVVYDISTQTPQKNIELYPGWDSSDPALGPGYISTTYTDHFHEIGEEGSEDLTQAQSASDYAVIDTSYTFSSWMGVDLNYSGGEVHLTGYPANANGEQIDQVGTVSADPNYSVLDYGTVSVSPGNSGGPLWLDNNGSDDVAGIVSTSGWACELTSADWSQIESWVSEDGYSLGTTPSYIAPAVTAVSNISLLEGQSIPGSSLIASVSNPSGDDITEDLYEDLGGGSGYFTVNGVKQPDGVWIYATPSENVQYVAGSSPGSDTLSVGIYDSTTGSYIYASSPVVATTIRTGEIEAEGGASDILLQNTDGQVYVWEMNGTSVVGGGAIADPGPSWNAIGTGDFYDNGLSDILLQNTDGQVYIWETSGDNLVGGGAVANSGPSWHAVGTGDFNDDGHSDILLQNTDGQVYIWEMNGDSLVGGGSVANPGPSWEAIGTGDFYGAGDSDILLQNANGQVYIWEMNGTNVIGGGPVADPGPSWKAIGTGDFYGNGLSDILLQNTSGQLYIWEMNGDSLVGGGAVSLDPGPSWRAIGTGGPGHSDILLQNTDGQVAIWDMSGTNVVGGGAVSPNPGTSWKAVGLT